MPGYDGTGPQGSGPFGRGAGPCGQGSAYPRRGFFGIRHGRRGIRGGLGWSSWHPTVDERAELEAEKNWLIRQLEIITQRLDTFDKE